MVHRHPLQVGAVQVSAPHPVPQRVPRRPSGGSYLFVDMHELVAVALADDAGVIARLAVQIHFVDRHACQITQLPLRLAREHRPESQAAQRQCGDLEKSAAREF